MRDGSRQNGVMRLIVSLLLTAVALLSLEAKAQGANKSWQDGEVERIEAFMKKHYDPEDVVAQVLNYSESGTDAIMEKGVFTGSGVWFWYARGKCVYAKAGIAFASTEQKFKEESEILDLNKVDPRTVKIMSQSIRGGQYTWVQVGDKKRFAPSPLYVPPLDGDRLERGWALIFSQHCKGAKKAF